MATAAERVMRYRDRKRRGVEVISIEVPEMTISALQFKDYLDDDATGICTDKALLAEAVQVKLSDWTEEVFEEVDDTLAAGEG